MIGIIIQARMGSTRLPGKVLREIAGKPMLEHLVERVKKSQFAEKTIVATSMQIQDHIIQELCERVEVECFMGSEHDVLGRYYFAAKHHGFKVIVRINGDSPLSDPKLIDELILFYINRSEKIDYASNKLIPSFPLGLEAEIFSFNALERAYQNAVLPFDREHVTPYFYNNPKLFKLDGMQSTIDYHHLKLAVDTYDDYLKIKRIFELLYSKNPNFGSMECIEFAENGVNG